MTETKDKVLFKLTQINKNDTGVSIMPEMDVSSFDEATVIFRAAIIAVSKNLHDNVKRFKDNPKDTELHKEAIKELLIGMVKEIDFQQYIMSEVSLNSTIVPSSNAIN